MDTRDSSERVDYQGDTLAALSDNAVEMYPTRRSLTQSQEASYSNEFKKEISRIYDSSAFVSRAVESLCQPEILSLGIDMEELLNDIEREEEYIFSGIPEYLKKDWERMKIVRKEFRGAVESKIDTVVKINNDERKNRIDYNSNSRIYVDPNIPLPMPFNKQRHDAENQKKYPMPGRYHDLFYGSRDSVVFTPPENNKRKEIEKLKEEEANWKKRFQRPERVVVEKQPTRKSKTVSNNFELSCANVDNSSAQKKLLKKKQNEKGEKSKTKGHSTAPQNLNSP